MDENIILNILKYNDITYNDIRKYQKFISEKRIQKISRLRFDDDKIMSLLSGLLMRFVISKCTGISTDALEFEYNPFGKPYLKNQDKCRFSLSNTKNCIIIAADKEEIGVDIENINNEISEYEEIAKSFFSRREIEMLENSAHPAKSFYDIWTAKESYIKMKGTGINDLNQHMDIFNIEDHQIFTERSDNYSISICCRKDIKKILYRFIGLYDLLENFK